MKEEIILKGKEAEARIHTLNAEEMAISQIYGMINDPITRDSQVELMPDLHAGKGAVVGTTIRPHAGKFTRVNPNTVGVDVGCGIFMKNLGNVEIDLVVLDNVANKVVPTGFNVNNKVRNTVRKEVEGLLDNLVAKEHMKKGSKNRMILSAGSLGGGNHYIELAEDGNGDKWLSVHTGSRGLGKFVAEHWQKVAEELRGKSMVTSEEIKALRDKLISEGKKDIIEEELTKLKNEKRSEMSTTKELSFLTGTELDGYLNDMIQAQKFAVISRNEILTKIIEAYNAEMGTKLTVVDEFDSIHNFIDVEEGILRKGATSARKGERLVIPLNMRDGSLICIGKGNSEWNYSAPHGAGRTMSRSKAKENIDLEVYKEQMKDVYTTSVGTSTLDEAPDAYKPAEEIKRLIEPTAEIVHQLKPLWNMKDHSKEK